MPYIDADELFRTDWLKESAEWYALRNELVTKVAEKGEQSPESSNTSPKIAAEVQVKTSDSPTASNIADDTLYECLYSRLDEKHNVEYSPGVSSRMANIARQAASQWSQTGSVETEDLKVMLTPEEIRKAVERAEMGSADLAGRVQTFDKNGSSDDSDSDDDWGSGPNSSSLRSLLGLSATKSKAGLIDSEAPARVKEWHQKGRRESSI